MTVSILLFGIARDIAGGRKLQLAIPDGSNVGALLTELGNLYPAFNELSSLLVAVNDEYADRNVLLTGGEEIALIPPVSGG